MDILRDSKWILPLTLVTFILSLIYSTILAAAEDGPIPVPLIKLEYPGNPPNIRMLYIRLLRLGAKQVNQPLLFDTGSSGMTIDCKVALPRELCSPDGIRIDKDTEVNGIVVTTEKVMGSMAATLSMDTSQRLDWLSVMRRGQQRLPRRLRYSSDTRKSEIRTGKLWEDHSGHLEHLGCRLLAVLDPINQ